MGVYQTLRQAILTKQPCLIAKPGEPPRRVCPYRLGKSAKGEVNVIYYQFGGYTKHPGGLKPDGYSENWRCNHVADIERASMLDERWHEPNARPRTSGASSGRCVVDADVEVAH